mmetsp:Transcript_45579/g.78790  ORF Transcript_45579/g.78790 Transcript_45579/m.78790 type:complete len:430 (-) Transcript_45579:259-1548(-)
MCSPDERQSCPSRHLCYETDENSEGFLCLCNRMFLFYGPSCERTPILTYFTITLQSMHAFYALGVIIAAIKTTRARRRLPNDVLSSQNLCFLTGLSATVMYVIDMVRLDPAFDDRFWELRWQFNLLALVVLFGSLNLVSVALIFLNRLAKADVIRGTVRSRWRLLAYLCQATAILFSVIIVVSQESQTDRLGYIVCGMLGVVGLLAGAVFRTQLYLAAAVSRISEGQPSGTSLTAQRNLIRFIKSFCFWLFLCLTSIVCMALFSTETANSDTPAVAGHMFHLGSVLALNQVGVVESDYFLLPSKRPSTIALLQSWLHQSNQCAKDFFKALYRSFQWAPDVGRAVFPVDEEWLQQLHPHRRHRQPFSPSVYGAQHPSAPVSQSFHLSASMHHRIVDLGRAVNQQSSPALASGLATRSRHNHSWPFSVPFF